MKRIRNTIEQKKGFTLIELIVVVAAIGILVLLAAPKFLGYTKDAKLTQIQNDVKEYEDAIASNVIESETEGIDKLKEWGWTVVNTDTLQKYVDEGLLVDKKGVVDSLTDDTIYEINEEDISVKSKLTGGFFYSTNGGVYYADRGNIESDNNEQVEVAKDEDFEWIGLNSAYAYKNSEGEKGYYKYVGDKQEVEIPHEIEGHKMTSYYKMFEKGNVQKVVSTNSKVTSMSEMFLGLESDSLDLNNFDTSNVTNMVSMFSESQVAELNLSSLDTENVTSMSQMFQDSQTSKLDLSGWNTGKVAYMNEMFSGSRASSLDLSNFDTSNVTNMSRMFSDSQATSISLNGWNTSNVTDMYMMFRDSKVKHLNLKDWNTSNVNNMMGLFMNSHAGQNGVLDLSGWDTSNVRTMNAVWLTGSSRSGSGMFEGSRADEIILGPKFTAENVKSLSRMFNSSKSTKITGLEYLNTSKATDMRQMFRDSQATSLDLSSFNTSNVTNMSYMFSDSEATSLDLSAWNTSNVTDMYMMFQRSQASKLDLSSFDTSKVTDMYGMFMSSEITTGYARTQEDADRFNHSETSKPSGLEFTVK